MASTARRRGGGGPGGAQWVALAGAVLVILGLTFALGLLVGRQWARQSAAVIASVTESARKPAAAPRRSGIAAETMADRAPESTEKLTFYKTLTEPLDGPGTPAKPEAKPEAKPVSVKIPAVSPLPPAPSFTDAPKPAPARPIAEPPSLPPRPGKTAGSGPAAEGPWTIQVGAYKNRRQADESRRQLASAGLDAYVVALAAQDGAARYRVRVGTYPTREEAASAAERLRTQRSLTTFVTPR